MDEDSIMIGVAVGIPVFLSHVMLYWTVALLDAYCVDLYLPGALFIAVSSLIPVLIVCSLSFLPMRHYNRPREWIKRRLPSWQFFFSWGSPCS
ncbi:hypothetical protein [Thermococcus sp. ES12]|uniref:hypothetical protein n=1 Tax=Thermococcus sp. ES12 TaxID=1638246 RepID=UPI00143186FA|nr:hypothetical protein [Thermococcus sp. ES12]NJE76578.1 hypothetical protein [Thermococcus sp. ES12]